MQGKHLFILVLFFFEIAFSQSKTTSLELQNKYSNYNNYSSESVFLHLNKTTFLKGEKIWFTAYLYNAKNGLPFKKAKNLYCGLYDSEGKQLIKSLFEISDGIARGNFGIKPEYGETLYVKAHTGKMNNLYMDGSFIKKIKIYDDSKEPTDFSSSDEFNIHLLPEGGNLLQGAKNTIAFRVVNQYGMGVPIVEAKVVKKDGTPVVTGIVSNDYGIGKFSFDYKLDSNYTLVVKLPNETTVTKSIPKGESKGIIFSVNNLIEKNLILDFYTNTNTFSEIRDKIFYLAVHRDGLMAINSFKLNEERATLNINRERLLPGINILSLFDENLNPIAERLLFNHNEVKLGKIHSTIVKDKDLKDSLSIQVDLDSKKGIPTNLSISILPSETQANSFFRSILTDFLFKPYMNNFEVEDLPYYFENVDRTRRFELDNLLMIQGWSKYDWEDMFTAKPTEEILEENGLQIQGTVKNIMKNKNRILLIEPLKNNQYFAEVDGNKKFSVSNALVFKDTPVQVMLFDQKGKPSKPDIEITAFSGIENDSLNLQKTQNIYEGVWIPQDTEINSNSPRNKNLIMLDNVTVSSAKSSKKYSILDNGMSLVEFEEEKGTLSNFVRKLGFYTYYDPEDGLIYAFYKRGEQRKMFVPVIIDRVNDVGFFEMSLSQVDRIIYDKPVGPIIVITKNSLPAETMANYILKNGFERPEEYYNPTYNNIGGQSYLRFGAVHWEPNLKIGPDGLGTIKIPDYGLKKIKLFIEGISTDGTLFSESKILSLN